ncbi:PREDICTED: endocuticle structural glycoprotein SgAbd-4-like [Nicrophorus vespilloides]|uniref:Endocuticle structural glycoprotein SgAbd-4-like n=1 Tax=Nicrophorus vespilloides TaxID=110193 RepID=A0ABM1NG37_NICVS|nr:PREDICTED: endocuticle structural glycoprotein SgAbd-4-like [Nicrophorus vespilloides]
MINSKKMLFNIIACALVASAFARPQGVPLNQPQSNTTPIAILSHSEAIGEDGTFNFNFESENGIRVDQTGYNKVIPATRIGDDVVDKVVQVITGSYSYQAPDGTPINLSFVADENGFQPVGDHLPTPPPIPEAIQRTLDLLPKISEPSTA